MSFPMETIAQNTIGWPVLIFLHKAARSVISTLLVCLSKDLVLTPGGADAHWYHALMHSAANEVQHVIDWLSRAAQKSKSCHGLTTMQIFE